MKLVINDIKDDDNSIQKYLPSPRKKQEDSKKITDTNLFLKNINLNIIDSESIYFSMLNRITTNSYDLTLYSGIVSNLTEYILKNRITELHIFFSKCNKALADFLEKEIKEKTKGIVIYIQLSKRESIEFSITKKNQIKSRIKNAVNALVLVSLVLISIIWGYFSRPFKQKKRSYDCIWMSFANNKEMVDLKLFEKLDKENLSVIHLDTRGIACKVKNSKIVYFLNNFSLSIKALQLIIVRLFLFSEKEKIILKKISKKTGLSFPKTFNKKYESRFCLQYINTVILFYAVKKYLSHNKKANLIFRGGNADAIVICSLLKNTNVILLPHGTEFYPIDHNTINYITYNLLPSKKIVKNWYSDDYQDSNVKLLPIGRPYYQSLRNVVSINKGKLRNKVKTIGIVLTYGSSQDAISYIDQIVESANSSIEEFNFLIKQRPNLSHDLSESKYIDEFEVFDGDIYSFLNEIDIVVVGISPFGIVGMVGTDAIYCDIPTIFYFGDRSFSISDLGYSWSSELDKTAYLTQSCLTELFQNKTTNEIIKLLLSNQKEVKLLLGDSSKSTKKLLQLIKGLSREI